MVRQLAGLEVGWRYGQKRCYEKLLPKALALIFLDPPSRARGPLAGGGAHTPRIDIKETDTEVQVSAALPGVDKKDI